MTHKQKLPVADINSMTVSQIEEKFRHHRYRFIRSSIDFMHTHRLMVALSGFVVIGGLFYVSAAGVQPLRATYASKPLSSSVWSQLEMSTEERLAQTRLTLQYGEQAFVVSPSDIGVSFAVEQTREVIRASERRRQLLPWQLIEETAYQPVLQIDESIAENYLRTIGVLRDEPSPASLSVVEGTLVVTPSQKGVALEKNTFKTDVLNAAQGLSSGAVTLRLNYTEPNITTDIAQKMRSEIEAEVEKQLTVQYDAAMYVVPRDERLSWYVLVHDEKSGRISYFYNKAKVLESVQRYGKSMYQEKRDSIVYQTADGRQVVSVSGVEGRELMNEVSILAAWMNGLPAQATFRTEQFSVRNGGLLNRYVVVNLSEKTASAYDSETLVARFPISGGKPSTPSPLGTFRVFAKTRVQTMSGPGYSTPNVEWITWYYPDYALHGAYWHNAFGQANVSQGCINFRNEDARWMYDWATIGTTVIVTQG